MSTAQIIGLAGGALGALIGLFGALIGIAGGLVGSAIGIYCACKNARQERAR